MRRDRLLPVPLAAARLALAGAFMYVCMQQWPAIALSGEIDALPDFNYLAAADSLRSQRRYAEALLVVETGYVNAPAQMQPQLQAEHAQIEIERDSLIRRVSEVGYGALTGDGRSDEALAGALAADMLVIGDVRDLAIQGARAASGDKADPVLVALSAAGLALTLAPEVDWSVALLKVVRRAGALSEAFAANLMKLARRAVATHSTGELTRVGDDVARLSRAARPAGAVGILRSVDDADMLHRAADFAGRPAGAFTLWVGEGDAMAWLNTADRAADAPALEGWLLRAGRKGRAGVALLASGGKVLLRPHVLLGLLKGFYKGDVPALLARLIDGHMDAIVGIAAGWLAFESTAVLSLIFAPMLRRRLSGA